MITADVDGNGKKEAIISFPGCHDVTVDLRDKLTGSAKRNGRSLNAELVHRLERSFQPSLASRLAAKVELAVAKGKDPLGMRVGDISSGDLVTVDQDKNLSDALQLMARHQVRRLPVVENGRLVGVVAQADVPLKENEKTGELVGAISEPSEDERR